MKGTLHGKNQQPSKDHSLLFKALEDLDRAECMVPRRPSPPLDSVKQVSSRQQMEKARDLYREAIGTLLGYVNDVTGKNRSTNNSSSSSRNSSDNTAGSDPNLGIEIDVLKERIKVALTHAEEIQETLRVQQLMSQRNSNHRHHKGPDDKQDSIKRTNLLQRLQQRSKSENMHHSGLWNKNKNTRGDCSSSGAPLVTCASADDTVLTTKRKPSQRRSNLNYNSNDPFIEIIKKDLYIDSKSIHTTWKDISGLQNAKQALQEAAILPLLRPDLYTGLRSAPRGILLYGPPGTGKTMLVRAVAHESQCILFACSASAMTSKWVGEAEKLVRTLFRMAADVAPSIIFLDEMDALLGRRRSGEGGGGNSEQESSRRFKTEFMIQIDGLAAGSGGGGGKTLLIGCTNCPWDVDDAVMRRFQRRIYVPLPDKAARRTLWQNLMDKSKGSVEIRSNRDLTRLVELTQGFSCSDIASIANEAAFGPLRDLGSIEAVKDVSVQDVRPIQMKDFEEAIRNAKKSVSVALLNKYDEWESAQAASAVKV